MQVLSAFYIDILFRQPTISFSLKPRSTHTTMNFHQCKESTFCQGGFGFSIIKP